MVPLLLLEAENGGQKEAVVGEEVEGMADGVGDGMIEGLCDDLSDGS